MESEVKKKYPSQINTKTISARIPAQDYVRILEEALDKGISLNDWLLIKIYSKNQNNTLGTDSDSDDSIDISYDDFLDYYEIENQSNDNIYSSKQVKDKANNLYRFCISWGVGSETDVAEKLTFSKIDLLNIISQADVWREIMEKLIKEKTHKTASIIDVKNQLSILIKKRFSDPEDVKTYRKELFSLIKELEED